MDITGTGSVVNLREKLLEIDRKKTQSGSGIAQSSSDSNSSSEKKYISDVIGIRNENKLAAASSGGILSKEEAMDMVDELKRQFECDSCNALDAHNKADANTVMQFYPFE